MRGGLFPELKRRNVWRAAALYAAGAWLLVQVATQVFPFLGVPDLVVRWVIVVAAVGFPFWIAFAWLYEITPEGIKRESDVAEEDSITPRTGRVLDRWIIGILAVALVLLLAERLVWHRAGVLGGASGPALTSGHGAGGSRSGGATAAIPARSIAVLPFVNESSDREQEYFADGISEDLLDLLTKITGLRVAARTSSFAFKGQNLEVPEIGRRLNVANVLQGSVRRAGDQVRISVQLVHAADGYQVWSQTWDRKLDDVFAIQDEIARDVAGQLRVRLLGGAAPVSRPTVPQAYALFLQARELVRRRRPAALLGSDSLLKRVLAIDPDYAPAWTELARNLTQEANAGVLPNEEGYRRGRALAGKALAIDSAYAPAHGVLAYIALSERDLPGAARELEPALALYPGDLDLLENGAVLLESLGRLKEAIVLDEYVVARDPVNPASLFNLGFSYIWAGRYDDAVARLRAVLGLSPGHAGAYCLIGMALLRKGDAPAALAAMQREPSDVWRMIGLPLVYHALGRQAASDSSLAALISKYPKDAPYNIAYVYAYRGEADQAFAWLDKAVEYGDPGLSEIPFQGFFDRVRSDPRWLPFLRRIGKAPEQLERIHFQVSLPPTGEGAAATE